MFLVSNTELDKEYNHHQKEYFIYVKDAYIKLKEDYLFIFDGYLYPDIKYQIKDVIKYFMNGIIGDDFKKFKGRYSGVFINFKTNFITFFNDQLGLGDVFYYKKNDEYIISNRFSEITKRKSFQTEDVDINAINEFLIFEYPLLDDTFIKNIKILPLASIYSITNNNIDKFHYWNYELVEDANFDLDDSIEKLDQLYDKSIKRIKSLHGDVIYGLGLSGGRDSRLMAHYALKNDMKLQTFVFGEQNSDAFFIAQKIAKKLRVPFTEASFRENFIVYSHKSLDYNPMMNVLYTWYYSTYEKLPEFDVLLTGFNGDNQMGGYLITGDKISDESLAEELIKKYGLKIDLDMDKVKRRLMEFLNSINSSTMNKSENFNYQLRQLKFVKNSPAFDFYGKYNGVSIFEDIDVIEYLLTVPYHWKYNLKLYKIFHQRRLQELSSIRCEGGYNFINPFFTFLEKIIKLFDVKIFKTGIFYKKSHKNVKNWLKSNECFYKYCDEILNFKNSFFDENFSYVNMKDELKLLYSGDGGDEYLFHRFLTVKMWLDTLY